MTKVVSLFIPAGVHVYAHVIYTNRRCVFYFAELINVTQHGLDFTSLIHNICCQCTVFISPAVTYPCMSFSSMHIIVFLANINIIIIKNQTTHLALKSVKCITLLSPASANNCHYSSRYIKEQSANNFL